MHKLVLAVTGAENAWAGTYAATLMGKFDPAVVVFAGIAGGIKDVRRGDVVVVEECLYFGPGKTGETVEYNLKAGQCDHRLVELAKSHISNSTSGEFNVLIGNLAATDTVLTNLDSPLGQAICHYHRKAVAVAMEEWGILYAAKTNHVPAITVRGISDMCGDKKPADDEESQPLAAERAARVAYGILQRWWAHEQTHRSNHQTSNTDGHQHDPLDDLASANLTVPRLVVTEFLKIRGLDATELVSEWFANKQAGAVGDAVRFASSGAVANPEVLSELWVALEHALATREAHEPLAVGRLCQFGDELAEVSHPTCARARTLRLLAGAADHHSRGREGTKYLIRSLADARASADNIEVFASLIAMAAHEHYDGDQQGAQAHVDEAITLSEVIGVSSPVLEAKVELFLLQAWMAFDADRPGAQQNLDELEKVLNVLPSAENATKRWILRAAIARDQGDDVALQKVLADIRKEREVHAENPDSFRDHELRTTLALAEVYALHGLRLFSEALHVVERVSSTGLTTGVPAMLRVELLEARAAIELEMNEPKLAAQHYEEALRHLEDYFGPNHRSLIRTLDNLGKALVDGDQSERAMGFFDRAVELSKTVDDPAELALHLQNRAWAKAQNGDRVGALADSKLAYGLIVDGDVQPTPVTALVALQYARFCWWDRFDEALEPLALARHQLDALPDCDARDDLESAVEELEELLLEKELDEAIKRAGVGIFPNKDGTLLRISGSMYRDVRERGSIVTPSEARSQMRNDDKSTVSILVAQEVRTAARPELHARGWSWFDRTTGEGSLLAAGTKIAISANPTPKKGPRKSSTSVNGLLRVGVWLLEHPLHSDGVREIARQVEMSPGQVSEILQRLRNDGFLEPNNRPLIPEFFREIGSKWPVSWSPLASLPEGTIGVDSGPHAAERLGAPLLQGSTSARYFYVASDRDLHRILAQHGTSSTQQRAVAYLATAPVPSILGSMDSTAPEHLASPVVVALDLFRGSSRDVESLDAWNPVEVIRVW